MGLLTAEVRYCRRSGLRSDVVWVRGGNKSRVNVSRRRSADHPVATDRGVSVTILEAQGPRIKSSRRRIGSEVSQRPAVMDTVVYT